MRDIYREVTEQIIAELKTGVRPWVQPWSETPGLNVPCNAITGRAYSGVNTLLLWTARRHGWLQPRFLTFNQAKEAGGHVRKGEHGRRVVFVKDLHPKEVEQETEQENTPRTVHMLKTSRTTSSSSKTIRRRSSPRHRRRKRPSIFSGNSFWWRRRHENLWC